MSRSQQDRRTKITYCLAVGILGGFALLAVLLTVGCAAGQPEQSARHAADVTSPAVSRAECTKAAPTTARGYAAMFARTPLEQWGGGDTAITVTLGTRHVWLFSDTLSTGRFVHSTAITQTGGCLHVSRHGAQLLPNPRDGWYWITSATRYGRSSLRIKALSVRRTGDHAWDFATGRSRYAIVTVNRAGDATFTRWLPGTLTSDKPSDDLTRIASGRVSYGRVVHRDIHVSGGGYLVTVCRNWDDGVLHPLRTYAPAFTAGS